MKTTPLKLKRRRQHLKNEMSARVSDAHDAGSHGPIDFAESESKMFPTPT